MIFVVKLFVSYVASADTYLYRIFQRSFAYKSQISAAPPGSAEFPAQGFILIFIQYFKYFLVDHVRVHCYLRFKTFANSFS